MRNTNQDPGRIAYLAPNNDRKALEAFFRGLDRERRWFAQRPRARKFYMMNRNGSIHGKQPTSIKVRTEKRTPDESKSRDGRINPTASAQKGDNGQPNPGGKATVANARDKPKLANAAKVAPKPAPSDAIATTPALPIGKAAYEWWDIDILKPFPLQSQFYGQESQADDDRLEQDLRQNGQRDPFPIMPYSNRAGLPRGTMLDGHRRTILLTKIGKKRAKVRVRQDLADADFATVEAEFLKFNFHRRQLDQLGKARIAIRLYEIEKGRSRGGLNPSEDSEARERVGEAAQSLHDLLDKSMPAEKE